MEVVSTQTQKGSAFHSILQEIKEMDPVVVTVNLNWSRCFEPEGEQEKKKADG